MTEPRRRVGEVVLRGGPPVHPFVYSKRIWRVQGAADGDVVRILTREGRPAGFGFFHGRSQIAVRVLTYDADRLPDGAWLRERLRAAETLRREVLRIPESSDAWRVVHGEGDGLSGLVVDRYGGVAVASLFSLGWYRRLEELQAALREVLGVDEVVARTDVRTTSQEGFEVPPPARLKPVEIVEHGIRFLVDPTGGHKTGFFLDQRDNRLRLAALARGRRVFDGMCYTGGFALAAARGGAAHVRAMDLDEEAVALARRNAERNGLAVTLDHGDTFDALRAYGAAPEGDRPEVVVVDPPKWAKDRAGYDAALAKYRDLNYLAMRAVRPEGLVLTHSCSGLVPEEDFLQVIRGAAFDARREVRFLSVTGAAPDHPVAAAFPEGRYLKCVLLSVGCEGSGPGAGRGPDRAPDLGRPV